MQEEFKYYAFISYASHDTKWGKRLQKKLEGYKMSATLCREHGWKRKPLNPIFFAPTDIQPGPLSLELQERLRASRNLIVICSPHSAKSQWVSREIEFFHSLGRSEHIYFFIVSGTPNSGDYETECFNPIVKKLQIPEILGVNINEKVFRWPWLNKERAYVQLITKLLGIEFDAIWKRHRRHLVWRSVAQSVGLVGVLVLLYTVWSINKPIDVEVSLTDGTVANAALPPLADAAVSIYIDKEIKTDTIAHLGETISFPNIPKKYMGKNVRIRIDCKDYCEVDTVVSLSEHVSVTINRDMQVYGNVHFGLWDLDSESMLPGRHIEVDGIKVKSDSLGFVNLTIPFEKQKSAYLVRSDELDLNDSLVYMPCGENDVICVK